MRDDLWLTTRLINIWENHFPDIIYGNDLEIRFGRESKTRLGSIALRRKENKRKRLLKPEVKYLKAEEAISIITINGHFKKPEIPEEIIDSVIIHEFIHFVHGFNSIRKKEHRFPHSGGVIRKELIKRNLHDLEKVQKKWIKERWKDFVL